MKDEQLINRLRTKYTELNTTGFNVFDFLHAEGSGLEALMYARLFWPEFIEIDDMVFLKETVENEDDRKRVGEAFEYYEKDRCKTEQSFNLVEIHSLFGRRSGETTDAEDRQLAELLAEMWRYRLQLLYPYRRFLVEVLEPEQTGGEVAVMFYQSRA
ncbi:MAG: hypothetical protein L0Y56_22340 [Nitrospira sp.]|nr:hypothetical protein [Nitrospira sp.]